MSRILFSLNSNSIKSNLITLKEGSSPPTIQYPDNSTIYFTDVSGHNYLSFDTKSKVTNLLNDVVLSGNLNGLSPFILTQLNNIQSAISINQWQYLSTSNQPLHSTATVSFSNITSPLINNVTGTQFTQLSRLNSTISSANWSNLSTLNQALATTSNPVFSSVRTTNYLIINNGTNLLINVSNLSTIIFSGVSGIDPPNLTVSGFLNALPGQSLNLIFNRSFGSVTIANSTGDLVNTGQIGLIHLIFDHLNSANYYFDKTSFTDSSQFLTDKVLTADGTANLPAYSFSSATGTGFYLSDTKKLGLAVNHSNKLFFDDSAILPIDLDYDLGNSTNRFGNLFASNLNAVNLTSQAHNFLPLNFDSSINSIQNDVNGLHFYWGELNLLDIGYIDDWGDKGIKTYYKLNDLLPSQFNKLRNINSTPSQTQWLYLSQLDQNLSTSAAVSFSTISSGGGTSISPDFSFTMAPSSGLLATDSNEFALVTDGSPKLYVKPNGDLLPSYDGISLGSLNYKWFSINSQKYYIGSNIPGIDDETAPVLTFNIDNKTGIYSANFGEISFSCNGSKIAKLTSTGLSLTSNTGLSIGGNTPSSDQWTYLSQLNQNLASSANPTFANLNISASDGLNVNGKRLTAVQWNYLSQLDQNLNSTGNPVFSALTVYGKTPSAAQWNYLSNLNQDLNSSSNPQFSLLQLNNGSASNPAYTFANDLSSGMYMLPGINSLGFCTNGILRLSIENSRILSTLPFNNLSPTQFSYLSLINGLVPAVSWTAIRTIDQSLDSLASPTFSNLNISTNNGLSIGLVKPTATQWGYLSNLDQAVNSASSVNFNSVNSLSSAQFSYLSNINGLVSSSNWTNLRALNQQVSTTSNANLASLNLSSANGLTIGSNTPSAVQWGYLSNMNQNINNSASPSFSGLTIGGNTLNSSKLPFLNSMDQSVNSTASITLFNLNVTNALTVNGITPSNNNLTNLLTLNQSLNSADSPSFTTLTLAGNTIIPSRIFYLNDMDQRVSSANSPTFATVYTPSVVLSSDVFTRIYTSYLNDIIFTVNGLDRIIVQNSGNIIPAVDAVRSCGIPSNKWFAVTSRFVYAGSTVAGGETASSPQYTFGFDTSSGMYSTLAGEISFSSAGVQKMKINSNGLNLVSGNLIWPTNAKGSLLVNDGSKFTTLAVGADNTVLTADSTQSNGVSWKNKTPSYGEMTATVANQAMISQGVYQNLSTSTQILTFGNNFDAQITGVSRLRYTGTITSNFICRAVLSYTSTGTINSNEVTFRLGVVNSDGSTVTGQNKTLFASNLVNNGVEQSVICEGILQLSQNQGICLQFRSASSTFTLKSTGGLLFSAYVL